MAFSGVRSWCETIEMNSVFASSERRSSSAISSSLSRWWISRCTLRTRT